MPVAFITTVHNSAELCPAKVRHKIYTRLKGLIDTCASLLPYIIF